MSNLDGLTADKLQKQIDDLTAGIEKFMTDANLRIAGMNGQVAALRWLLEDEAPPEPAIEE